MKHLLWSTTLTAALVAAPALADNVALIDNIDEYDDQQVTVSGVVSWVEDANEFTIADNTGDVEVNLLANRLDIDAGDYVTVTGRADTSLLDEAIDRASVTVLADTYDVWYAAYEDHYDIIYDLNGLDTTFYETVDWDDDRYDDYWIVPE